MPLAAIEFLRVVGPWACIVCDGYGWLFLPSLSHGVVRVPCMTCDGEGRQKMPRDERKVRRDG